MQSMRISRRSLLVLIVSTLSLVASKQELPALPVAEEPGVLYRVGLTEVGAFLWVGKDVYAPAEWVDVYGDGWHAEEPITFVMVDVADGRVAFEQVVMTDEEGAFTFAVPRAPGHASTYTLAGTGALSGATIVTFTDAVTAADDVEVTVYAAR
jgi:hypothetical protein